MKLYEHQGKELFKQYDIPVPKGVVIEKEKELEEIEIPFPWVMKAQVLVGGRGKAGGVKFIENDAQARKAFHELMRMEIKGNKVKKILVEEALDITKEYYISIILDRSKRSHLLMFSQEGGVDIESVADEKILKIYVNPLIGIQNYHLRKLENKEIAKIAKKMYLLFKEKDCELVEINPLVVANGKVMAADAKIIIDDGALYRHEELPKVREEFTELEREAREKGISFVQLGGNIGVIANGAGLTMATLDALNEYGGRGGVFLDLGGTDDPEKVKQAFELMKKAEPKVIFLNLFGGITKCDTVAKGVKAVLDKEGIECPVVARIKGMNEEQAMEILKGRVITISSFHEAAKKASELGV
ncbi:MAG: ADP-forming succinate--CoA ligase subunit beta [Thermoplasmata archaeon]|nr:MAG: ADP-forming succinate--CoA ligase subunit beta [Thermoplasmata archaeon]